MVEETPSWLHRLTPLGLFRIGAGLALVLSLLLPASGLYGVDICLFHRLTGRPCPGCGMTRAFCAIGHGHFSQAWGLHPFAVPFYCVALLLVAGPILPRALGRPSAQRCLGYLGTGLLLGMAGFGLWRMVGGYPWP